MFSRISKNAEHKTISWPGPAVLPFLLRFQSHLRKVFSWPGRLARARSPPWGHRSSAAASAEPRCIAAEKDLFNYPRDLLSLPENKKVVVVDWFAESPLGMTFATEWHPCYPWRCLPLELTPSGLRLHFEIFSQTQVWDLENRWWQRWKVFTYRDPFVLDDLVNSQSLLWIGLQASLNW